MGIRIGCMASNYAQIAMMNYWQAKQGYKQLDKYEEVCAEVIDLEMSLTNHTIVTITFAAMAIEAYLNDYAAQKIGDKMYYDHFDMLRPMGKLKLISKFLLQQEIINGSTLYNRVNDLFKNRNALVHSKSKDGSHLGMTEEECQRYVNLWETAGELFPNPKVDMADANEKLKDARGALLALREVGSFFDQYDPESFATTQLLVSYAYSCMNPTTEKMMQEVQRELRVPILNADL